MPVYAYKGLNEKDKKVKGLIDAESTKAARQKLRKTQIYPTELTETVERKKEVGRIGKLFRIGGGVPSLELAVMTRQMSTLVGAQLPLVQCLSALTEQVEHDRLRTVLAETKDAVNEGASLADALAAYPRIFSDLYINMIGAGEHSGALEVVLERLADFTESQADLRNKVLYAMLYPVIILVIMAVVVIGMFTLVIPKITVLLAQSKQAMPPLTLAMISMSDFAKGWGGLFTLIASILLLFGLRYYIRTPAGAEQWDRAILKMPVMGRIARNIAVSRFCKTLATLLYSGIPLLKALEIVEKVVANRVLGIAIGKARENISEGASIADPLRASRVFPPFVIQMIASGEASGELEFMLEKASSAFDREVENAINGLTALIEPIMILVLAGMVVLVILSFLLPILDLTAGIG